MLLDASEIVSILCPAGGYCVEGDVLEALLRRSYSEPSYLLLWQALYSRRATGLRELKADD